MNEGYSIITVPEQKYIVCDGCKFLNKEPMIKRHRKNTYNYSCMHPDAQLGVDYRWIHLNHEGECNTPSWCPYLKKEVNNELETRIF